MNSIISNEIKLNRLLSLVLHILGRANRLFNQVKKEEFKVNIIMKEGNERFTEADWVIQKMIENYFTTYFPGLKIIGEEDTSKPILTESEYFSVPEKDEIAFDLIKETSVPNNIFNVEDLVLYTDPIDSTEQFIKKNFQPVTCLLGICLKSKPLAGFIHFPEFEGKEDPTTIFNIPGSGLFAFKFNQNEIQPLKPERRDNWTFISSMSRTNTKMREIYSLFKDSSEVNLHGLGNKSYEAIMKDYIYFASGKGRNKFYF